MAATRSSIWLRSKDTMLPPGKRDSSQSLMTAGNVWAAGFLQVMRAWMVPPSEPESLGMEGTVYQVG